MVLDIISELLVESGITHGNYSSWAEPCLSVWSPSLKRNAMVRMKGGTIVISACLPYEQVVLSCQIEEPDSLERVVRELADWASKIAGDRRPFQPEIC